MLGLLQRWGKDSPEVAPTAGDQHSHAANFLEWRDFLDELEILLGEERTHRGLRSVVMCAR